MAVVAGGLGLAACSFAMPSMDFFSSKPTTASLSMNPIRPARRRPALDRRHLPHAVLAERGAGKRIHGHRLAQRLHAGNQDGEAGLGRGQRRQFRSGRAARSQSAVRRSSAERPAAEGRATEEKAQAPDPGRSPRGGNTPAATADRFRPGPPRWLRTAPRADQVGVFLSPAFGRPGWVFSQFPFLQGHRKFVGSTSPTLPFPKRGGKAEAPVSRLPRVLACRRMIG